MGDFREPILPQEDGVVDLSGQNCGIVSNSTIRVDKLLHLIKRHLGDKKEWLGEGFECELLVPGGIWQRGKIRLQLEFHPKQEENLLDAHRGIETNE
jgi:hypothetical protein